MSTRIDSRDEAARLEGTIVDKRYRLERLISAGMYGTVYEVADAKFPDSRLAIKLSKNVLGDESSKLFQREATLLRMLEHPNIVRVYDYGLWFGLAFIVMEFLNGETLSAVLKRENNRLSDELISQFVKEIGDALAQSHSKKCVHRDLKPENILLVTNGISNSDSDRIKQRFVLIDFGIATKTDATGSLVNQTCAGLGTPEYRSPEQVNATADDPLDENLSTDIYTFGVILFQLLAGQVPFPMKDNSTVSFARVTTSIARDLPPRPSDVALGRYIDPGVEQLILQCLEKDPARRPQTIGEVRKRFLQAFDGSTNPRQDPASAPYTGTILPDGDTDHPVRPEPEPRWMHETRKWAPRGSSRSRYWYGLVALLVAGVMVAAFWPWPRFSSKLKITPSALTLCSTTKKIRSHTLHLTVPEAWNAEDIGTPELRREDGSEGPELSGIELVSIARVDAQSIEATVEITNPVMRPGEYALAITVPSKNGGPPLGSAPIRVNVEDPIPHIWCPENFRGDFNWQSGELASVDDTFYFKQLVSRDAKLGEEQKSLVFCLITPRSGEDPSAFYIMKHPVCVGLFRRWGHAQTVLQNRIEGSETQLAGMTVEQANGKDPRLPLRFVLPKEACQFAKWLVGQRGDLPTKNEWNAAASHWLHHRSDAGSQKGHWRSGETAFPIGQLDDGLPGGCPDMANNVQEWTRSPHPPDPPLECKELGNKVTRLQLVGKDHTDLESLTSKDLKAHREEYQIRDPKIGFRIVLHIPER